MAKSLVKTFQATLRHDHTPLQWTIISVPREVTEHWQASNRFRVKGEIMQERSKGFAFRTSLFPTGKGDFILLVNKRMQTAAKVTVGSVATFRLEPDTEERDVSMPAELAKAISGAPGLRRWYDRLPYSIRKYLADNVTSVKSPEARVRRAEQMAELVLSVQEAERELPPILEAAFVRAPLARQGWQAMTPIQRRGHLLGIFYYRTPESRQKRAAKAIEEAVRIAKAKAKP